MSAPRKADAALRHTDGDEPPAERAARACASSSNTEPMVNSTSACTDTKVSKVTSPACPWARPMSVMPIITMLENTAPSASTMLRGWKPRHTTSTASKASAAVK